MSAGWTESMRQAWRGDCIGAGCPCCDPPRIGAVSHTVVRRASRPYVCQSCAAPIAKGERYERTDGIANGRAWHWIQCEDSDACQTRTEARDAITDGRERTEPHIVATAFDLYGVSE